MCGQPAGLSCCAVQAHEALQRAEEEAAADEEAAEGEGSRRERERVPVHLQPRERERWDCESVLRWVGTSECVL